MFYVSDISGAQSLRKSSRNLPSRRLTPVQSASAIEEHTPKSPEESQTNPYTKLGKQSQRETPIIYAYQIMSQPVITINTEDTISTALSLFKEKQVRHLPVTARNTTLVGILSHRDSLLAPSSENAVRSCMTTNIITARPKTTIRNITEVMFQDKIGCMPIVSEDLTLSGIITRSDILYSLVINAPMELWA